MPGLGVGIGIPLNVASGTSGGSSLLTGLVSWWTLNETSGARADSLGGNTLSVTGTVSAVAAKQSNGSDVTGTINFLATAGDPANMQFLTGDFTLAAWVKRGAGVADLGIISKYGPGGAQQSYCLICEGNAFKFFVQNAAMAPTSVASGAFADTNWHFVVGWRDTAANLIWVQVDNGAPTSAAMTGSDTLTDSSRVVSLHTLYTDGTYNGTSTLDEACVWSRMLTAGERTTLYNAGNGTTYANL